MKNIKRGFIFLLGADDKYLYITFILTIIASIVLMHVYGLAFAFMPFYYLFWLGQYSRKRHKSMFKGIKGGRI